MVRPEGSNLEEGGVLGVARGGVVWWCGVAGSRGER